MSWAHGTNAEGREIGYGVEAVCDHPGCSHKIDRGLGFVCGGMHDGDLWGCGKYFCGEHLRAFPDQLCEACQEKWFKEHPEVDGMTFEEFVNHVSKLRAENGYL